ncbi:MAG: SH3 domain-containing protein [Oscillospiraceae bacterium]|nr:SH3 domain-containing protein [Oscillospiraceae bacterium]
MVTFTQLKTADEILAIEECYALVISPPDSIDPDIVRKVAVLQLQDGEPARQILVRMLPAGHYSTEETEPVYPEADIADSLSSLLIGSTVLAEPDSLRALRSLFNLFMFDGELSFLPISKLSETLFPELTGMSLTEKAEALSLKVPEGDKEIREATLLGRLLRVCQEKLGKEEPAKESSDGKNSKKDPDRKEGKRNLRLPSFLSPADKTASKKKSSKTISNKTLKTISDRIWHISPWVFAAIAAIILLAVILLNTRSKQPEVDRNVAPNSYLVLSWNETGTYGSKQKGSSEIDFRIPYGVYNVLNNNSIPVELNVYGGTQAQTLSTGEDAKSQKVTIRPNSSREITVDTDQYVTLSEDAVDLIFFYVSPVPEEVEETSTGQVAEHAVIVYGYVKGTDVRFRNAPSLEGNIIQTLNNGQQVQILGVTGEWTYVSIQDQKGYIFSDYVSKEPVE